MDDRVSRTRHTYDRIAPRFLERTRNRVPLAESFDRFARLLPPDSLVLDVGAGPGFDSTELRRRGVAAISVDLSAGMLRAGALEFPGPRAQADARSLPFASGSVGGVWANASLLHLPALELGTALREARRVLQPGGLIQLSVKRGSGHEWETKRYGEPRWFQYWSGPELDRALGAAGFELAEAWNRESSNTSWLVRLASRSTD